MTEKSIIGRLAPRRYVEGDDLPEVGSMCLVSGANADAESDQHRAYGWSRVVGYTVDKQFVCLQVEGCWPTVERLTNCWFANEAQLMAAAAPELLFALRRLVSSTPVNEIHETGCRCVVHEAKAAIAKAEGRWS